MSRFFKIADLFYLLLIGVGVGCIVACGVFVAPIVFKIGDFITNFSQAESGIVMGKIFVRLNYFLIILAIVIAIYEILCFSGSKFSQYYSKLWLILGLFNIVLICLFVFYYTPFILDTNNLQSEDFVTMHSQSVLVFKILMFSLSVLFVWRAYKAHVD